MSTHKNIDKICVVVLVISLIITVLFMNGNYFGIETIVDEDAESYTGSKYFTARDLNGEWDTSDATVITLNRTGGKVVGAGAYAYDGDIVITSGGYYVVSGELEDGSIIVDAYSSSKVWIMLQGVNISCSDDACVRVNQADKVFLTLAPGTENYLSGGDTYSDTALEDGTDGVIFAHDDLTINGSGTLTVNAAYKHGIAANDDLVITGGTITVNAVKDAIRANDSIRLTNAEVTVAAEDDGVVVAGEDGYLYMESGAVNITSADDGIHTSSDITIAGGSLTVAAGDDGIHSDTTFSISDGALLIEECYEGIEAKQIDISGGEIAIYPSDDGLNANGGSSEMGGMNGGFGGMGGMNGGFGGGVRGDAGAQSETESGADVRTGADNASDAHEETNGSTDVQTGEESSDSDNDSTDDAAEELEPCIRISGGQLTIVNDSGRDADGIDSNGDIYITGGTIFVSVVNSGSNSAVDYGSESGGICEISGGTIVACGSYSMAESFDSTSEQCSVLYTISEGVEAGTEISLEDTNGNVLLSYTVPCSFSSALLSCPQMQLGETYRIRAGENTEEFTQEEISTFLGDVQTGMFGGNMQGQGGFGGTNHRGGGRKGFGGGQSVSGNQSDFDGQMPDFGSMQTDGEMPDFSGFQDVSGNMPGFDGQMPDFADMQTDGEMPDFDGGQPVSGNMPEFGGQMPGEQADGSLQGQNSDSETNDESSDAAQESTSVNDDTWILLGASALVLLAGLLFAVKFKQK